MNLLKLVIAVCGLPSAQQITTFQSFDNIALCEVIVPTLRILYAAMDACELEVNLKFCCRYLG
ncbi:hypothetical protein IQ273_26055 [Nodosilinea sp. LEGE 07298]|nr:hypothetical protein [Nodosilinea sp. LEGE 07298]